LAGIVATGAALGIGELVAGLLAGAPSPILSVGRVIIDLQPPGAKEVFVDLFGTADKLALELLVLGVALGIGAVVGLVGRIRPTIGMGIIGAFVGVGFLAGLRDSDTVQVLAVGAGLAEFAVGAVVLDRLLGLIPHESSSASASVSASMPDWSRRTLLLRGGAVAVGSVVAARVGRSLLDRQRLTKPGVLPTAPDTVSLPAGADLGIPGLTPIVVPTPDFYRIDTALIPPNVDRSTWSLRIHGMVDREVTLTYAQLIELPIIEQYVTIACVSNQVGGALVGNTKWTGVRLRDVLDLAGVQPAATQLVGRSVDGWTAGSPTAWIMDPEREPMIAIGMNDEPLTREHGYPARVIVPGLYGYVSATKWVTELELTTLEAFDAYWIPLGWAKEAPILTQARIDLPAVGRTVASGPLVIAGVAWAPDRGISRVEVSLDDAEFRDATLSVPISEATWVQWQYSTTATVGFHTVQVRATDGRGVTQTATATRPDPDGARGWHRIAFQVE
ncbi:MAG: molybdopterin-dependent oxidoreductase, partial [Candidatus Limnocylindrales bacterium]